MKVFHPSVNHKAQHAVAASVVSIRPLRLTRTFVETGDERCPIAGIWMRLTEAEPPIDEPESTRPAMRRLLLWRAIHPPVTAVWYSAA
jgi:hypothetical protein